MAERLYLVTGGTGFLGSELIRQLREKHIAVRALVRPGANTETLKTLGVELAEGDLRDIESLRRATNGIYGVYHIGAIFRQAEFGESVFFDINVDGTRKLLDASIESGVKRFVHCSTGGVLGNVQNPPGNENTPYNPGDMYQRSKVEGEKLALEYFRTGKIRGVVIRPAMIYGPGDTRNLKMFRMVARGTFFYVGKGNTPVHFVDVRDVAKAFILAMEHEEQSGGIYHIPGESSVPLKNVVEIISKRLGVSEPWLHIPVLPMQLLGSLCEVVCRPLGVKPPLYRRRVDFFTKTRHFDGSRAEKELGYHPSKHLEQEVTEITDWYREHGWL